MSDPAQLLVERFDIWIRAVERKNGAGRGNGGQLSLYGIERLRSLILDLALRGKLVPQDAADEPASALAKRLDQQCADQSMRKLVSKYVKSGCLAPGDHPYKLPQSWEWVNVAKIGHSFGQSEPDTQFTYIDVGSIDQRAGRIVDPTILEANAAPSRARKIVKQGTVIYSTVRPYLLNIAIVDQEFDPQPIASTAFAIVHPFTGMDARFIYRVFRSPFFVKYVEDCQTGIAYPAINDKQFFGAPFPLPPLAEQKRIAAKVDELMALSDALEAGTREAMAAHEKLVRELLATLANSKDADELATNWSRIEAHFDTLFTTEESVEVLRQTVLELAVTGRLASPEYGDEPVQSLITRVARQRSVDIKSGRVRKQSELPSLKKDAFPGRVPRHWEIVQLDELVHVHSGITKGRKLQGVDTISVPYLRVANVQRWFLNLDEVKEIEIAADERDKYELHFGDLLVTEGGDWDKVGRTCVWRTELDYCAHQNHVFKARKILPEQKEEWLELFLNSAIARQYFANASKQTTNLASINKTELRGCPIPLPPTKEQSRILEKYRALSRGCDELMRRLRALGEAQFRCA